MSENYYSSAHIVLPPAHLDRGVETSSCHKMWPHLFYWFTCILYKQRPLKKIVQCSC